jgi:hypothetical protein
MSNVRHLMNFDSYFDDEALAFYKKIATEDVKRKTVLESVRDVCFVYEIHSNTKKLGGENTAAILNTVRIIAELIELKLIKLAQYATNGETLVVDKNLDELIALVESEAKSGQPIYFVTPDELGKNWVKRYWLLLNELEID